MSKKLHNHNLHDPAQILQAMEKAQKESERKYRELVDMIPLGIFELDINARLTHINPLGMEMMGYNQKDLEKELHVFRFVVADEMERVRAHFYKVSKGLAIEGEEFTAVRKNGNTFPVMVHVYPILEDEKVIGVRGVAFDLSKPRKIERQLQELLERYEIILDAIPDLIFRFDKDGRFIDYHASAPEKLHLTPEKFVGKLISEVDLPRELRDTGLQKIREALEKGETIVDEYAMDVPGGPFFFEARYIPIGKDEVLDIIQDITFQKKAMESLRLTQFSVDQNPDAAFWMNRDARFFYVNETACKKLGYTEDELLQMTVHDIDPLFPTEVWARHWQEIKELKSTTIESVHRTKDGSEFPVELLVNFIEFDGNEYNCVFARDISKRKLNEENLRKAKEKAELANRVKSEFISNISHEIRTPLNSIIGFSEMLGGHLSDPRQKEYALSIKSAGDSLLMLINDILDLSKIEAGRLDITLEPINLRTIISEVSQIFGVKVAQKNLDFVVDVHDDVPESLMLDKVRIRQVLFNLIGNAVKFSSKGFIRLVVSTIPDKVPVKKTLALEIIVEDSGIGIPKEFHESIFRPFVQVGHGDKKGSEGTGLGLSITKRLVEMMSGRIELQSRLGEGSSFKITLENVEIADKRQANESERGQKQSLFYGKHVLLVDDSEINRRYVKDNLVGAGVLVSEADNGKTGIEMAALLNPDLILMDIMMPVMDGYEAVNKMKADPKLSAIPVMALTALAMKEDIERISKSGFDTYLIKPFHIEDLYGKMSDLLGHYDLILSANENYGNAKDKISEKKYFKSIEAALILIEDKHMGVWQQAIDIKEFKSIRNFAGGILETGKDLEIMLLVDYGEKLMVYCDNYDIERIDGSLSDFPNYVEKMKRIIETQTL